LGKKGCLIVFEGIEGSGKTTASRNLAKYLTSKDYRVKWTREPTTSKIGSLIEDVLLGQTPVADEAVPLLFAADRADHTRRIIVPSMNEGCIVISDRYTHSSLAYQKSGMGKVFRLDWLKDINKYAIEPDLVIFLDITPEEGLSRIGKWQRIHDDKFFEDIEAQRRIRQAYHEVFKMEIQPVFQQRELFSKKRLPSTKENTLGDSTDLFIVDASKSQEKIQGEINEKVHSFLKIKGLEKPIEGLQEFNFKISSFDTNQERGER
jgi:dTMP kinase